MMLTPEAIRAALDYDPETGVFRWKPKQGRGGSWAAGRVAGGMDGKGYWRISIKGVRRQAHRLAWLHFYGVWPDRQIDHINGNRLDNRISNLRLATNGENQQNAKFIRKNTGAYPGVTPARKSGRWQAQITHKSKYHYLGTFDTPEDAHAAFMAAKAQLHTFQPIPRDAAATKI